MRVTVYGLGHLGTVTAACAARAGHAVVGLDPDPARVKELAGGSSGLLEDGLDERLAAALAEGRLTLTTDSAAALRGCEILWVAFDTPVDDEDAADVGWLRARLDALAGQVPEGALLLLSSQVPAGFTAALEKRWFEQGLGFACAPENLRRGEAVRTFEAPARVVVGLRAAADRPRIEELLRPFTSRIEWTTPEAAEMAKHALNAWLATSIAFVNELARLCHSAGADVDEVLRALRSDPRVGERPYFTPGVAFSGGTLARDLRYLGLLAAERTTEAPLAAAVLASNAAHQRWTLEAVRGALAGVAGPVVAVLGLSGKAGTDAVRRSTALELALGLERVGVRVRAHDPALRALPSGAAGRVALYRTPQEALAGADVVVLAAPWPEYERLRAEDLAPMRRPCVVDPGGTLRARLGSDPGIDYRAPGRTTGGARG